MKGGFGRLGFGKELRILKTLWWLHSGLILGSGENLNPKEGRWWSIAGSVLGPLKVGVCLSLAASGGLLKAPNCGRCHRCRCLTAEPGVDTVSFLVWMSSGTQNIQNLAVIDPLRVHADLHFPQKWQQSQV